MSIVVPYDQSGRIRQKARTRNALIDATRSLLADGRNPSVEEAAAEAGISRATAYRYFPNQHRLLAAVHPETEATSLLGADPPLGVEKRLDRVIDEIIRLTLDAEPELRAMLRLSLEPTPTTPEDTPLRVGRRIMWVADALAPLRGRLAEAEHDRLVYAIAAAIGIDTLVWMVDVAGLSRARAGDLMRWSARALLTSALAEPG
jgi:AcrR family transcriptional regulator